MPSIKWQKTSGIIEKIAAIKDNFEIESLKTAIEITDEVFEKIIPDLKAGAKEKYLIEKTSTKWNKISRIYREDICKFNYD